MRVPVILVVIVLAAASLPAAAVENGRPDGPRHQNVGLLGIDFDGPLGPTPPFALCSGFVISDSVFVTAAHCIEVFGEEASWVVTLHGGSPDDPTYAPGWLDTDVFNIDDLPILHAVERADSACIHPDFDPVISGLEHDVAVLNFAPGTFGVSPVRLAKEGMLDAFSEAGSLTRMPLRLVGYGHDIADPDDPTRFHVPGHRRTALSGISGLAPNWLFHEPIHPWNGATGFGDSGSPQFLAGRAVSLQSSLVNSGQRLDTAPELGFLANAIADGACFP